MLKKCKHDFQPHKFIKCTSDDCGNIHYAYELQCMKCGKIPLFKGIKSREKLELFDFKMEQLMQRIEQREQERIHPISQDLENEVPMEPTTQADVIRSMSDEELSDYLESILSERHNALNILSDSCLNCYRGKCTKCILNMLKSNS